MKHLFLHGLVALVAALLSSLVPRDVFVVLPSNMGCDKGCMMVAAGWPCAYLVDRDGTSPAGSVSLVMGLIGEDHLWPGAFFLTWLFWLVVSVLAYAGYRRGRRAA